MSRLQLSGRHVPLPATLDVAFAWSLVPDAGVEIDLDSSAIAYDADTRHLTFTRIADPHVRLIGDGTELFTYRPGGGLDGTAVELCALHRDQDDWRFVPVAEGFPSGMVAIAGRHGLRY
jgi:stress response protein SCP2